MTLLKLKSHIYRYTGIYLAHKEENEYLQSKDFWNEFHKMKNHPKNDMDDENIQGLLVGLWQCGKNHNFTRPMVMWHWSFRFKYPLLYPVAKFFADIHAGLKALKCDIESLFK
jgi:hypothetical protein